MFKDVAPGTQFYAEMSWLALVGVSTGWPDPSGCPTFRPLQAIDRDAMAAFLYRHVNGGLPPLTNQCGAPYPPVVDTNVTAAEQLANGFDVPGAAQARNTLAGLQTQAPIPGSNRGIHRQRHHRLPRTGRDLDTPHHRPGSRRVRQPQARRPHPPIATHSQSGGVAPRN